MVDFLRGWVTNIIYMVIFIAFLEILLPNNSIRKYVRVVAGLLIIVVILTPIAQLFNKNINMESKISEYYLDMSEMDIKNQNKVLKGQQNKMTLNLYKTQLENQMKNQVEKSIDGINAEVKVDVFSDPKNDYYGEVDSVQIYIQEQKNNKPKKGETLIEPIKKIEVGEVEKKKEEEDMGKEENPTISQSQQKEIKEFFLDFYNISSENISINKQMSNMDEEVQ